MQTATNIFELLFTDRPLQYRAEVEYLDQAVEYPGFGSIGARLTVNKENKNDLCVFFSCSQYVVFPSL